MRALPMDRIPGQDGSPPAAKVHQVRHWTRPYPARNPHHACPTWYLSEQDQVVVVNNRTFYPHSPHSTRLCIAARATHDRRACGTRCCPFLGFSLAFALWSRQVYGSFISLSLYVALSLSSRMVRLIYALPARTFPFGHSIHHTYTLDNGFLWFRQRICM